MPDLKPFIVIGVALGGVYALSGVGLLILYRTSGVLNFAYGAVGAFAALVAWSLAQHGQSEVVSIGAGLVVSVTLSTMYGVAFAARFSERDQVVKASATIGYAVMLLGASYLFWSNDSRTLSLSTSTVGFTVAQVHVNLTEILSLVLATALVITVAQFLKRTRTGTVMRALACDRELTAMLGPRVRRIEVLVWMASGLLAGVSGVLFASLVELDASALTFLVVAALATVVIGRFRSLGATLAGGLLIGVLQSCATPFASLTQFSDATPFVVAIIALLAFNMLGAIPGGRST